MKRKTCKQQHSDYVMYHLVVTVTHTGELGERKRKNHKGKRIVVLARTF